MEQIGLYITQDGHAAATSAHTSCPFTEGFVAERLFMTPDTDGRMGKLFQDYIDDARKPSVL